MTAPSSETDGDRPADPDRSVLGTSIVGIGLGDDGYEVVALWNLGPSGVATGAWVVDADAAFGDAATARRLLVCLDGRAVTGVDVVSAATTLRRLTDAAGLSVPGDWWEARSFAPVTAFGDVLQRRAAFESSIEARRATTKNIAVLEWSRDYSTERTPDSFDALRALSPVGAAPGAPAVSEALTVSRVLSWVAALWTETEQPKGRRTYLRDEHGAAEPLPPAWRAATRTAGASRLTL